MRELKGICKKALEHNLCLGCNKLELPNFVGQEKCNLVKDPRQRCKEILGIQERLDLWNKNIGA